MSCFKNISLVVVRLNMSLCYRNNSRGSSSRWLAGKGKHITEVVQNQINGPDQACNSREGMAIKQTIVSNCNQSPVSCSLPWDSGRNAKIHQNCDDSFTELDGQSSLPRVMQVLTSRNDSHSWTGIFLTAGLVIIGAG